ncbi:MAG: bifunctional oligoribonuclease/PAP phosphatase NrnA, partial [Selenomonadaceae bacterium]|nr:bifunctional oligoribonuclease/PAP phosphatase NrnA [Selenomonadaceae bacterium]
MKLTLQETATKIKSAEKILVTAHISPDGDALGSTLAMCQALRQLGKVAQIYLDDKLPTNLDFLPHIEEIKRPAEDEKFDADLLLIIDTAPDRIGNVKNLTDAKILNVDHHVTNKNEVDDLYLDANAAAACEIIFELCKELGVKITPDIAICLYTGIVTDTGFFNYSNTTTKTFHIAAELVESGVKPNYISEQVERRKLNDVKVMAAALQTMQIYFGGKVAGLFIDEELAEIADTTEGFVDLIRVIDTVEVAFVLQF